MSGAARPKIDYVVFDMDGLLIDSERVYTDVTNELLAPHGKEMTWDIKAGLMGKPEREAAAHLLSFFPDLPPSFTIDYYLTARRDLQDERWPSVRPLPGALRLVRHLHKHGVPIALATGSQRRNFELKSAHNGALFDCFEAKVVCADDGLFPPGRGKPHPDIFLVAAEKFLGLDVGTGEMKEGGVSEEARAVRARGLVFEDGIPGVQAGKRAGMSVVWVPDANLLAVGAETPSGDEQADITLKSLEEFVPEEWGLPPYDAQP
ncbi:HAD-like protein [Epithele typhae]|uniref:HAD-like protein n=1 Tax=Epithele typhae TaxID=378194 RepID=UPI00200832A3|nr:HAD-like protein [Epithele typhae]KAH9942382.1 HAD-like protein [Epithele typhae]